MTMFKKYLTKLIHLGVKSGNPEDQLFIRLSNILAMVFLTMLIIYTPVISIFAPNILWTFLVGIIFYGSVLVLNGLDLTTAGRTILALAPSAVIGIIHTALVGVKDEPINSIYTFQVISLAIPWSVLALRERWTMLGASLFCLSFIFGFQWWNGFIETQPNDIAIFQQTWIEWFILAGAFGGLFFVFYFYQDLMRQSARAEVELREQLESENQVAARRQEEINQTLQDLEKAREEDRKRNWATEGIAQVATMLRSEDDDQRLYDNLISYIVKYMKANQGGLFLLNEDEETDPYLELKSFYAYERKKYLQARINPGEGLVGQVFLENRPQFFTKIPPDYIRITSGLGEALPRNLVVCPLTLNDKVFGVIEIASFQMMEAYQVEFLVKLGETIAGTLTNIKVNLQTRRLLESAQQQAEELRAQEEEMRQNMEELEATQEEINRKNREIEKLLLGSREKEVQLTEKIQEIEQIRVEEERKNTEMLEYMENYKRTLLGILDQLPHKIFLKDKEGRMVLVNSAVAEAHSLRIDQLLGKSDFDFVDAETAREWRKQELAIVAKGEETYVVEETIGGKRKVLKTTKMAFPIRHLQQTGLLGIQTDITEVEELRQQLK